jgi:hypothetical protein
VTPKTRKDLLVQVGATVAALFIAVVLRRFLDPQWEGMLVFVCVFLATLLVKLRWPEHAILGGARWPYFLISWLIFGLIALVLSDVRILGFWFTVPAAVVLGLLYCVVHVVLVDGPARRRKRGWGG